VLFLYKTIMEKKPDEEVNVKLSICGKCNGIVRVAVEHMMKTKDRNEFGKEVVDFNLSVKEQPLLEYRKTLAKWCECEHKK
jgi:hypothetical protein